MMRRIIESHPTWALVVYEHPQWGFHIDGNYKDFCKNCTRHLYQHFRNFISVGCSNYVDIEDISLNNDDVEGVVRSELEVSLDRVE